MNNLSEKEKEKEGYKQSPLLILPLPLFNIDELILRFWPENYNESLKHLINARIEILKAINAAIEKRIEELEAHKAKIEEKREKVKVE